MSTRPKTLPNPTIGKLYTLHTGYNCTGCLDHEPDGGIAPDMQRVCFTYGQDAMMLLDIKDSPYGRSYKLLTSKGEVGWWWLGSYSFAASRTRFVEVKG